MFCLACCIVVATHAQRSATEQRASKAETPKPPRKRGGGRPPGQPGVAMADAKKLDEFAALYPDEAEEQLLERLKGSLRARMTTRSVARRARAAKAQWHADKKHQKT